MAKDLNGHASNYRLLLLEDDSDDALLVQASLENAAPREFELTRAARLADALELLADGRFDVMLSDLGLPDSPGPATVQAIRERAPAGLPLVVLTGRDDEALGRDAIKLGAQDYLMKGRADGALLARALRYAIERKRLESGLREANEALARRVAERTAELQAANAALRANVARDHAMMQATTAAIITADDEGRILKWNPAAGRTFGYREAEVLGQPLTMLMPPRHRERYENGLRRVKAGGRRHVVGRTVELEASAKGGREFPIALSLSEWETCEGRYFTAIIHDISERRRAEQTLARQRDLYDALSRTNEAIVRSCSPEELFERVCRIVVEHGRFLFAWIGLVDKKSPWLNEVATYGVDSGYLELRRKMKSEGVLNLGLARRAVASGAHVVANDFLAHPATTIWHEAARARGVRAFASFPLRRMGEVVGALNIYAGALGAFTDDLVSALDSVALDVSYALDSFQREAARRRSEEALRESEERFRGLFVNSHDAILHLTPDGEILDANPAACRLFCRSEDDMRRVGRNVLVDSSDPRLACALARGRRHGAFFGELAFRRADETEFNGEVAISVFSDKEGRAIISMLIRDLSERKRVERLTRALPQQILAAQEEERRRISTVLHHDVGSLAVGTAAYLDAIEADLRVGKIPDARAAVRRARTLFSTTVVRLKDLALQLRPVELDILGLRAALRQHFVMVTKTGRTLIEFRETLGSAKLPEIAGTTLFRIAQEALTNAIEHGGATKVHVRLGLSKQRITMTIRDNGTGFDVAAIADQETPRMGLRVMREMASAAGGELEIESSPGKGCTLRATVARTPPEKRLAGARPAPRPRTGRRARAGRRA